MKAGQESQRHDAASQESQRQALESKLAALDRSQAIIEFDLDGTVLAANANFLAAMGYAREEVVGRHHSMFMDTAAAGSEAYHALWRNLRRGEFVSGEFKRLGKGGREVWIQATYNPVLGGDNRPVRIVKIAADITQNKIEAANFKSQIEAIGRSQAVIEFDVEGKILSANENFLAAFQYGLNEIVGQHHRMFVEPEEHQAPHYRAFWDRLRQGETQLGRFKRLGKGGRVVWIQACYSPILDAAGKPFKVVKFATDITAQVDLQASTELLSLVANGTQNSVIITDADGRIEYVNPGFERMTGYSFAEVQGKKPGHLLQGPQTSAATIALVRERLRLR